MNDNITKTVSEVKQRYRMKEATATNGPEGTVSKKTQVSLNLLEQGTRRLHDSITTINKDFLDDVELCTLLTTVVENLHAVSHFKHETFTVLQYSQDFGTITKESLKENNKIGVKYFTHDKSYYPRPADQYEVCQYQLYATAAVRRNQSRDGNCYERIGRETSSREAKESPGRNYKGQSRGFTTGSLLEGTRLW